MPKIIAIGGGEIGRAGYPIETTAIDKEIIRLSGKKNPLEWEEKSALAFFADSEL